MAQAAILLAATRHITVASGMTDIYARDPVTDAAAQRTLEEAYPGRFLLGLWESHASLAQGVRGHRSGPGLATMCTYLDVLDNAPFGPPGTVASPNRVLAALDPGMLALAAERARGATVLGMPVEYTRAARTVLGDDGLLAITQLCVLSHDHADTADLARTTAAAALPNRHDLLRGLGHENPDALDSRLVDALVAHGRARGHRPPRPRALRRRSRPRQPPPCDHHTRLPARTAVGATRRAPTRLTRHTRVGHGTSAP